MDTARLLAAPLSDLLAEAAAVRDAAHGTRVTWSPKVFIPLTMLCRDKCGYCTFARGWSSVLDLVGVRTPSVPHGTTEAEDHHPSSTTPGSTSFTPLSVCPAHQPPSSSHQRHPRYHRSHRSLRQATSVTPFL